MSVPEPRKKLKSVLYPRMLGLPVRALTVSVSPSLSELLTEVCWSRYNGVSLLTT